MTNTECKYPDCVDGNEDRTCIKWIDGSCPGPDGHGNPATEIKDHQIAQAVNELRDIAIQYHATQQLRERISRVLVPLVRSPGFSEADQPLANFYGAKTYPELVKAQEHHINKLQTKLREKFPHEGIAVTPVRIA